MAKKKKSGKKGKGKEKKDGEQDNEVTELEREMFRVTVEDLESKLARRQHLSDSLEKSNQQYKGQYEKEIIDKEDIVEFLKRSLQERAVEIQELQDKLIGLQHSHEKEKEAYEKKLTELQAKLIETRDTLTAENMMLSGKLAMLEEFRLQKENLMAKMAELELELSQQSKIYKEKVHAIEKKAILDNEKLKKEMVQRVEEVAAEFRKASDMQLSHNIKQTINESVKINLQLQKTSEMTLSLTEANAKLKQSGLLLKQELEIKGSVEKDLASKVQNQNKVIKLLQAKCDNQKEMLNSMEVLQKDFDIAQKNIYQLKETINAAENEIENFSVERRELHNKLELLQKVVSEEYELNHKLLTVIKMSEDVIKAEVMAAQVSLEEEPKRAKLLQQILTLLDAAVKCNRKEEFIIQMISQEDGLSPQDAFSPYYVGDLGFVQSSTSSIPSTGDQSKKEASETSMQTDQMDKTSGSGEKRKDIKLPEGTAGLLLKDVGLYTNYEERKARSAHQ